MSDEFLDMYRAWSDERLVAEYHNRDAYEADAVEAMKAVLAERDLEDAAADEEPEAFIPLSIDGRNLIDQDDISPEELLREARDAGGTYYVAAFLPANHERRIYLPATAAIVSAMLVVFSLVEGELFAGSILVFLGVGALLAVIAMHAALRRRVELRVREEQSGRIILDVGDRRSRTTLVFPFDYRFGAGERVMKRGLGRDLAVPELFFAVRTDERPLVFSELLSILDRAPAGWGALDDVGSDAAVYGGYPFTRPDLHRLRRILEALASTRAPE